MTGTRRVAIVQARTGSTRLPGKVLARLGEFSALGLIVHRLRGATSVDAIAVAVPTGPTDDDLARHAESIGVPVVRGPEHDVLSRFVHAAEHMGADVVVRITGDCPLIDPGLVDATVERLLSSGADYASNVDPPTFPDGLDVEAMQMTALLDAANRASSDHDREHVTAFLRDPANGYTHAAVTGDVDWSRERWTLDTEADLAVLQRVLAEIGHADFSWRDVLHLRLRRPEIFSLAERPSAAGREGQSTGQALWERAQQVIPGGSMLLSKKPDLTLPGRWPVYFAGSQGCTVTDLDGRSFFDFLYMGLGTNVLGYRHPEVDSAVADAIARGNHTTLLSPEEVELAERLTDLHPWSDMARFTRSGGEAVAVAVRIARAASGREKVLFCGYHGWHDWYLAANLRSPDALDEHLIPGLSPYGVPSSLTGTAFSFRQNDLSTFQRLADEHRPGVIIMEVMRNEPPAPGFLEAIREAASRLGSVLIFDECTSGFRETFGGLHKKFEVNPDIAVFGKALGNGYAVAAVVGRREVMECAAESFISSTFWTGRIGSSAALKALDVMERERSWEYLTRIGDRVARGWEAVAASHGVPLHVTGMAPLPAFLIGVDGQSDAYRTLVSQEMLDAGFLAGGAYYASLAHSEALVDRYLEALDPAISRVARCIAGRESVDGVLAEGSAVVGFGRLN